MLSKYKKLLKACVDAVREIYDVKELKEEHIRTVNTLFIQLCRNTEETAEQEEEKATEKQKMLLSTLGIISTPRELTKKEASLLIEIIRRNKRSLVVNLTKELSSGGSNGNV